MYLFIRYLRHAECQAPCQVRGSGNTKTKERSVPPGAALGEGAAQRRALWHLPCRPGGCSGRDLGEVLPELWEGMSRGRPYPVGQRHTGQGVVWQALG